MSNFVLVYLEVGKIDVVMEFLGKVFEQSYLGEKYFFIFMWMVNIVGGFVQMGFFEVVEEFGQKVLSVSVEVLGEDYLDIIFCMFNLVMIYCGQVKKN